MKRKLSALAIALSAVIASGISGAAASETSEGPANAQPFAVEFEGEVDLDGLVVVDVFDDSQALTMETHEALLSLERNVIWPSINTVEVDKNRQNLIFYVAQSDVSKAQTAIEKVLPKESFSIQPAKYSKAELDEAAQKVIAGGLVLADNSRIVSVGPLPDGSALAVGVNSDNVTSLQRTIAPRVQSSVPVVVEESEEIIPAYWRWEDQAPYKTGAYMRSSQGACTTGFWITTTSTLIDRIDSNLTADHCGTTGTTWMSGQSSGGTGATLGVGQGQAGGGSDHELLNMPAGTGVSKAPYVYVGVYNGNAIAPIAGYTGTPQVGNSVCYTGTQSGQVCSNTVTRVNQYICYSYIPAQCYGGLTVTEQSNGVPAAGNGDSGGPVISAIGGVAYASGIISGISNPGSNCTGKPSTDTRKCSTTAIYAPISHFFNNNGGHAIYVAPSS